MLHPSRLNCSQFPIPPPLVVVGANLWVEVPGGQQVYVDTPLRTGLGAVGYTQAHSTDRPTGASFSLGVDTSNHFVYTGPGALRYPTPWLACPQPLRAGTKPFYQVFARLQNVTLAPECVAIQLGAKAWPSSQFGAWQYV